MRHQLLALFVGFLAGCAGLRALYSARVCGGGKVRPSTAGHTKALFVYVGLHPESFQLIKVYIN
jgi:hypothetical protein